MSKNINMRTLPLEGLVLKEFVVEGNGKDAEVRVVASDGRRFVFGSSSPHLKIAMRGTVLAEVTGPDDATLKIRYTATHLVLHEAQVRYPGSAKEWADDLETLNRGHLMSWAIQDGNFTLLGEEASVDAVTGASRSITC